jgi:hypothetical protein
MRIFLITLAVSLGASIGFWNFGLAAKIWPAHPLFATTLLATACAMAVQIILTRDEAARKQK